MEKQAHTQHTKWNETNLNPFEQIFHIKSVGGIGFVIYYVLLLWMWCRKIRGGFERKNTTDNMSQIRWIN